MSPAKKAARVLKKVKALLADPALDEWAKQDPKLTKLYQKNVDELRDRTESLVTTVELSQW